MRNALAERSIARRFDSAKGFVRSEIGKRVRLRFTPEVQFKLDNSLEKGNKILELIDKISTEAENFNENQGV